jgi:hypothetical protein
VDVITDADAGKYQGWSGYPLTLTETARLTEDGTESRTQDSGIFEGQIIITDCSPTDLDCLKASGAHVIAKPGENITVEYTDCTLSKSVSFVVVEECVTLTSEAKVVKETSTTIPPLERFGFANARVVDEFGNSVSEVTVGQQIQIVSDVINLLDEKHSFAYVTQVQNTLGDTVALEWTEGSLNHLEEVNPTVSWTPSAPGSYTITLAVWMSLDNPSALAPLQSIDIDVIAKTPEPVTAIPEWIKNNAGWWAEGQIDDNTFVSGIQHLVKIGIIKVS